jgi:hypothetical protein
MFKECRKERRMDLKKAKSRKKIINPENWGQNKRF